MTVGTNAYSVTWRLIGERARVVVSGGRVRVYHDWDDFTATKANAKLAITITIWSARQFDGVASVHG
ncbi:MAG: hypothetical protein OXJ62_09370 [Spirochaetaceae bacterium]|nr:hypothetical protein [Spirochaetaceae bacterium]